MNMFVLGSFVQACCWSVERLPIAGETFISSGVTIEAGGKGLNVAICTRRLGANVDVALGIGQDQAGDDLLKLLKTEGINTEYVYALSKQSGYGAGLIAQDGQNAIAVYPGPNLLLNEDHIKRAAESIKRSNMVYGQFETSIEAIIAAFEIAKHHQTITVLNPSPWKNIPNSLLNITDILIVNEVEAAQLFKINPIDFSDGITEVLNKLANQAQLLFERWQGQMVIVTLGEHGSVAYSTLNNTEYSKGFKVNAIDTVGAGDAFASGFCVHYLEHHSVKDALQFGNACGAIVASTLGVLDALPNLTTALDFVNKTKYQV